MNACYHTLIDTRLLRLVEASIRKIDADPSLRAQLSLNVSRWPNPRLRTQWERRLKQPWPELRAQLLADSEEGARWRQDAPLAGILSASERADIMRQAGWAPITGMLRGAISLPADFDARATVTEELVLKHGV